MADVMLPSQTPIPGPATIDDAKAPVQEAIATTWRDVFNPVFNGLIRSEDDTLIQRGRGRGLRIYDELERDAHCYSVLQKRKMAVIGREWSLEQASTSRIDKKACDMVQEHLENMACEADERFPDSAPFDLVCFNLLDALLKGFSVGETMWDISDEVRPTTILARNQRRFTFDADSHLRLLTYQDIVYGEPLPARKFVVHRFGSKDGNPWGLGIGSQLFWPVFFKRQSVQFWLTFLDKFGSPTALGKYPSGASLQQKSTLMAALRAIAQEAQIAVPVGMEVQLLEAAKSSNSGYEAICHYFDDEMSKCVLGETMSTRAQSSGMGSSQANVQNEVRLELTKADADLLAGTLNRTLIAWDVFYNMPGAKPPRISWEVSEAVDRYNIAQADKLVFDMGYEPDEEYIQGTYGDGWTKKAQPQTPAPGTSVPGAFDQLPAAQVQLAAGDPRVDAATRQGNLMAQAVDPALQGWIAAIRKIVDEAKDMNDLRDRLMQAFPNMSLTELASAMQAGFSAAQLAGRYDLLQGLGT